jgi:RNA-directed DNA polymerase
MQEEILEKTKQFDIPKQLFVQAYKLVRANEGAAGIDSESIGKFALNLKGNLYKLWNRMSSGSYIPPAVKAVEIPKKMGGKRILGVPTVGDRICQMVIKLLLEPKVEPYFLADSYGYRPGKSALDAIDVTRKRCWQQAWVIEFDISGLFDNLDHTLLMRAVKQHTDCRWIILYIERWLKTPMQLPDGRVQEKTKGVMQGGVISPVLSNLFLHYVFDRWMKQHHSTLLWCRYADDGLVHCKSQQEAEGILSKLKERFAECGLELHPDKTRIVYCKDSKRKGNYPNKSFDFLGYTFRERACKNKESGKIFTGFNPAVSKISMKSMRTKIRKSNVRNRTDISLEDIAKLFNPIISGWMNYYGKYNRHELYKVWRHFNQTLIAWAMKKYKSLRKRKKKAGLFLEGIAKSNPNLFVHWRTGMIGVFI